MHFGNHCFLFKKVRKCRDCQKIYWGQWIFFFPFPFLSFPCFFLLSLFPSFLWTAHKSSLLAILLLRLDLYSGFIPLFSLTNPIIHTRLMLLHDSRNEDGIKSFFQEVHELYIKVLLNPLYLPGSRITSSHFDTKVRALARKYLWDHLIPAGKGSSSEVGSRKWTTCILQIFDFFPLDMMFYWSKSSDTIRHFGLMFSLC